jgi:hypothetical protein
MCLRDSADGNYKKPAGKKKYQKTGESGLIQDNPPLPLHRQTAQDVISANCQAARVLAHTTGSVSAAGWRTVEAGRPIVRLINGKTDSQNQLQGLDLFNNARHRRLHFINLKPPIIKLSLEISTLRLH